MKTFVKSKLHRVRVTGADLNYTGSITIGRNLIEAAGLDLYELVHINNLSNANHWETYVVPGEPGEICLNGAPARLFQVGDEVVVLGLVHLKQGETATHRTVFVSKKNKVKNVVEHKITYTS
jgi:aspartate 1-decarboxylase